MTLLIKQVLKERSITATRLSEMMTDKKYSLSRVSIGNIINGVHSPKVETLEQIADTLGMDVRDLFAPKETSNDPKAILAEIRRLADSALED